MVRSDRPKHRKHRAFPLGAFCVSSENSFIDFPALLCYNNPERRCRFENFQNNQTDIIWLGVRHQPSLRSCSLAVRRKRKYSAWNYLFRILPAKPVDFACSGDDHLLAAIQAPNTGKEKTAVQHSTSYSLRNVVPVMLSSLRELVLSKIDLTFLPLFML